MRWFLFLVLSLSAQGQTTLVITTNQLVAVPCYPGDTNNQCSEWGFTNSIPVASNEVVQILNYSSWTSFTVSSGQSSLGLTKDDTPITLSGPLVVNFFNGLMTYKLTPKDEPIQPGTGVVIPSDATGPVEIILESSADLVNWTASVPGIYGANTTNRFFRVRAVRR